MIKAIETKYKGYRFRSRLEARWAVAFDEMGIEWEYEPEGYRLQSGEWYLPDFRVMTPRGRRAWVEIKGGISHQTVYQSVGNIFWSEHQILGFKDDDKTCEFARSIIRTGGRVFLFGDIPDPREVYSTGVLSPISNLWEANIHYDKPSGTVNWASGCLYVEDDGGRVADVVFSSGPIGEGFWEGQKYENSFNIIVRARWPERAYEKARSARFEHGESPT